MGWKAGAWAHGYSVESLPSSRCEVIPPWNLTAASAPKNPVLRDRRYSIRITLAADEEMLELQSGNRTSGVTSDLSLAGCFVRARRTMEVGARVHGTLTHEDQQVKMFAVVRVVNPQVGMGLEFLDIDPGSNATLLTWIEYLCKAR